MRRREFPVLGPEDADLVDSFAVGLDRDAARVLAYLLLCETESGAVPASRLAIRVGTDLGRERTVDVLSTLESAGLVTSTTIDDRSSGRPRKGWTPAAGGSELGARVRTRHAGRLLEQARTVVEAVGNSDIGEATDEEDVGGAADTGDIDEERSALEQPADPVEWTVVLNWTPNGFHAPLFLGAERGHYRDENVDLTIDAAEGSVPAVDAVESGQADVGIVGSAVLSRALAAGTPVVPVALLYQRAMTVLYTIRSVFGGKLDGADGLRGRTVGTPARSETALLARLFLSQAGVLEDVDVIDTAGEERDALLEGGADVVTGMAADPPELEAEGHTVDSILVAERFPVPGPALVVRAGHLADPPPALVGFLSGTMAGVIAARRDPEAAARAVAASSEDTVAAERRRFEIATERFGDSAATRANGWGWQAVEDWQRLLTALGRTGALPDVP